jgi:hypothetical protein
MIVFYTLQRTDPGGGTAKSWFASSSLHVEGNPPSPYPRDHIVQCHGETLDCETLRQLASTSAMVQPGDVTVTRSEILLLNCQVIKWESFPLC